MLYEVVIPNAEDPRYDKTYQVQANSWRSALRAALIQVGREKVLSGSPLAIATDGHRYEITDPRTRASWKLHVIEDLSETASTMLKAMTGSIPTVEPSPRSAAQRDRAQRERARAEEPAPKPREARPADAVDPAPERERLPAAELALRGGASIGFKDRNTGQFRTIGSHDKGASPAEDVRILTEGRRRTADLDMDQVRAAASDGSARDRIAREAAIQREVNEALENVFLNSHAIFEPGYAMEDAIDFILDQAADALPSEAGALLFASDDGTHLYAAAAFGDCEEAFLQARLPITEGLPGICLRTGISLCAEDLDSDARHTPHLREALGLKAERSLCLAPISADARSYGVLLLINREERPFVDAEANILAYLGQQLGTFIEQKLLAGPI